VLQVCEERHLVEKAIDLLEARGVGAPGGSGRRVVAHQALPNAQARRRLAAPFLLDKGQQPVREVHQTRAQRPHHGPQQGSGSTPQQETSSHTGLILSDAGPGRHWPETGLIVGSSRPGTGKT